MAIYVECPVCGRKHTLRDRLAGQRFRCLACGEAVVAGMSSAPDATAALAQAAEARAESRREARNWLVLPAIALIILTLLSLASRALFTAIMAVGIADGAAGIAKAGPERTMAFVMLGSTAICGLFDMITLAGAIQMLRLKSLPLALAAGVLSVFPCASACIVLAIPIGAWTLLILTRDEVQDQFT